MLLLSLKRSLNFHQQMGKYPKGLHSNIQQMGPLVKSIFLKFKNLAARQRREEEKQVERRERFFSEMQEK